jgi:redox-sensitive bicupin YhaK (pirin superfamily)
MTKTIYRAADRGHANHGWLDTYHTFSFAGYYNPERIHFGALRVLNDDTVSGGMGFGTHPHDNMEIVSIPLEGALEHRDTLGNTTIIKKGEVQIMSAGTGVQHSEKNHSGHEMVKFLQIWIFPEEKGLQPRYEQKFFEETDRHNKWQIVVSPMDTIEPGVKINQNAWFSMTNLEADKSLRYSLNNPKNGVFVFNLSGSVKVADELLERRDAISFTNAGEVEISAISDTEILVMEVPMYI